MKRGFTLIEVLTAMVVVGILAAIAIPSWRSHLLKARRSDARSALVALQKAQDQYFGRHARYAGSAQLTSPSPGGLGAAETSPQGYYRIALETSADGLAYRAVARAESGEGQTDDSRCEEFSLDHNGQRRARDAGGADRSQDCWR